MFMRAIVASLMLVTMSDRRGDDKGNAAARMMRGGAARPSRVASPIYPAVDISVGFSQELNRALIRFTVRNLPGASAGIESFSVQNVRRPLAVKSPPEWMATYGWDVDS